jgi:two-component system chemotaxis sensor kinase CheA
MVNLVGELVTVQARLSQTALTQGIAQFISIAEEVERLTVALRDNTMSIRMLPIGTTFSKFKRAVRDLSAELGKEIELTTEGAETELDKTVIEKLSDPLVHLIRNCVDHGIETPEVREAAGKPRRGAIHLSAVHSGAHVLIQIKDDGAGLDIEAIRAKAAEKGLVPPDATPSDKELFSLILMPDFSTAKKVTSVSGRGVGLDVVKKAIDALRGTIEITSIRGTGATITLKLPLTLAIIDGFLTKIGAEHFIFPLASVEECIELKREAAKSNGRHLVNVRGHIVPYIRLREKFMISGATPAIEQIVIVGEEGRRVGFAVDVVVGEHQTVLKSLGKFYKDVEGVSGATILGDGTVALILDIPKLIRAEEIEEDFAARNGGSAFHQTTADAL